jgi:hypothetical protein
MCESPPTYIHWPAGAFRYVAAPVALHKSGRCWAVKTRMMMTDYKRKPWSDELSGSRIVADYKLFSMLKWVRIDTTRQNKNWIKPVLAYEVANCLFANCIAVYTPACFKYQNLAAATTILLYYYLSQTKQKTKDEMNEESEMNWNKNEMKYDGTCSACKQSTTQNVIERRLTLIHQSSLPAQLPQLNFFDCLNSLSTVLNLSPFLMMKTTCNGIFFVISI